MVSRGVTDTATANITATLLSLGEHLAVWGDPSTGLVADFCWCERWQSGEQEVELLGAAVTLTAEGSIDDGFEVCASLNGVDVFFDSQTVREWALNDASESYEGAPILRGPEPGVY